MQAGGGAVEHLRAHARGLVARAQQEAHDDEAAQKRGAALADEGKGEAGQRDEARNAAHDDEGLQHDHARQAHGHEAGHVGLRARRGQEAADGEAQEQQQHAGGAQKADLLGDVGEDEIAFHDGDGVERVGAARKAVAQPHAEQVAVGDGVERLAQLVAGVLRVGERVEPSVDAHLHVAERRVSGKGAHGDQAQAHHQVELLTRCNVKHEQEHEEEHHGAAQVLLEHHDDHGHAPHEQKRQQRSDVGQVERAHADGEHGQQLAVLGQIACHEQHDDDLGDLAGLEGEAADVQPDAAAVNLLAKAGDHRREQQKDAHEHEGVLIVGDLIEVAEQRQHHDHAGNTHEQPDHLALRHVGRVRERRDARDEGDADAR